MSGQHYSLFGEPWWLDAVAGAGNWSEASIMSDGALIARWPYVSYSRLGLKIVGQPPLTQTLGPWFAPIEGKASALLAREKELYLALLEQMPSFNIFRQNFHFSRVNGLPMHWQGFSERVRYTYVLNGLSDIDAIWSGLQSNIRREIRKAKSRFRLKVVSDLESSVLSKSISQTFRRQGRKAVGEELIVRVANAAIAKGQGQTFYAVDEHGRVHASILIVWDASRAYYLAGGADPDLRTSGAHSLLMWEAIASVAKHCDTFDFEGSMNEKIERFFRAFGAVQQRYSQYISATPNVLRCALTVSGRY